MLTLMTIRTPHALEMELEPLHDGIYKLTVRQGFMDRPDVPAAVAVASKRFGLVLNAEEITYYVGHHTVKATAACRMGAISERVFAFLVRNVRPATEHFSIPAHQIVESGSVIDL